MASELEIDVFDSSIQRAGSSSLSDILSSLSTFDSGMGSEKYNYLMKIITR